MTTHLIPVFYTSIRPAHGQTEVEIIRRAHALGYELVSFAGWTDADIGYAGNRGPSYTASRNNLLHANKIRDACVVETPDGPDWPHIIQSPK